MEYKISQDGELEMDAYYRSMIIGSNKLPAMTKTEHMLQASSAILESFKATPIANRPSFRNIPDTNKLFFKGDVAKCSKSSYTNV